MIVDFISNRFVAQIAFEEREIFRSAGWKFDASVKQWVTNDAKKAQPFQAFTTDAALAALKDWAQGAYGEVLASFATESDSEIPTPPGLEFDGYQKAGIVYASTRYKTLIADPPGLGKTIQAVGLSNYLPQIRSVLIIPPAHLKINWQREWQKWDTKGLSVGIAYSKTHREKVEGEKTSAGKQKYRTWTSYHFPDTDVVIINYDSIDTPDFYQHITDRLWDLVVLDEAQYLVSETAIRTRHVFGSGPWRTKRKGLPAVKNKAVAGIKAKKWLALSGTPLLSRPSDLWTLCKAFDKEGLGANWLSYIYTYCGARTIGSGQKHERIDYSGASNLPDLQTKLRQRFMVRRPKSILSLPPKRHQLLPLPQEGLAKLVEAEMSAAQRVRSALARFESIGQEEVPPDPYDGLYDVLERRFGQWQDRSYNECIPLLSAAEQVAFEEMSEARKALAAAKIPMVVEHLENLLATGQKVIVFVVHTEMAEALKAKFPDAGFITGKVPSHKRQAEVDRFQEDIGCRLMIGNIVAAGTGFTMTAASLVVFAELDWVPARMEQAEDRAWRRGQVNSVLVQHLAVIGSLDARLVEVLLEKQRVVREALDHEALPIQHGIDTLLNLERDLDGATRFSRLHSRAA